MISPKASEDDGPGDVTDDTAGVVGDAGDGSADGCVGVDACDDVACEDAGADDDGCVGNADRVEDWVAGCTDGPDPAAAGCSPCCCARTTPTGPNASRSAASIR